MFSVCSGPSCDHKHKYHHHSQLQTKPFTHSGRGQIPLTLLCTRLYGYFELRTFFDNQWDGLNFGEPFGALMTEKTRDGDASKNWSKHQEKSNKSCLKVLVELSCVSNVVKIFVISKYHQNRYISPLPSQESKNVLKKNFNWWRSKLISEANHVFVGKLSVQLHLQSRRKRELNINISQSQLIVCLVTRVMQMLT